MSNFTIEITAPTIVTVLEKLIAALAPKAAQALPQTPSEQAARQHMVTPVLTYTPPMTPIAQPTQYAAPVQQYQPAVPVNPVPAAPIPTLAAPPMNNVNAAPQPTAPIQQAPVAAAPAFTLDDIARAASQLMDTGKQQDLLGLLSQFGVQALTHLPQERYGEFATALRQMGAKI